MAFITGGANGIGLGIARAFAAAGAKMTLTADRDGEALDRAKAELSTITEVETVVLDVRDRDAFARTADEVSLPAEAPPDTPALLNRSDTGPSLASTVRPVGLEPRHQPGRCGGQLLEEAPTMRDIETIADGLIFAEAPRWHDGALHITDMHGGHVLRIGDDGAVMIEAKLDDMTSGLGWLPDGRLLVVSMADRKVMRREPAGQMVEHADLNGIATFHCTDMIVAADGTAYVGNFGFSLFPMGEPRTAAVARVDPAGDVSVAAADLWFPNGLAITADGGTLVVAESAGYCLTAFAIGSDGTLPDRRVWRHWRPGTRPTDCVSMRKGRPGSRCRTCASSSASARVGRSWRRSRSIGMRSPARSAARSDAPSTWRYPSVVRLSASLKVSSAARHTPSWRRPGTAILWPPGVRGRPGGPYCRRGWRA